MRKQHWMMLFSVCLVVILAVTGCKSKSGKKGRTAGENVDDVIIGSSGGIGMGDIGLDVPPEFLENGDMLGSGGIEPVYFEYDSSHVSASERGKIEQAASMLQRGNKGVIVEGHCDERGSREYNLALGERRALAVRAYLVGLGIAADKIHTKSLGEEQPKAMGHDEAAWRENRRCEFSFFDY